MSAKHEHVGRRVEQEIKIDATPLEVWKAWAEADGIAKWFVDRCEGDARAGEVVTWHFDQFGFHQPTPCLESVPGESVVYGAEIPGRLPIVLEVRFEEDGGGTRLRLVNSGFVDGSDWDLEYEGTDSGWGMALATLKQYLERYPGAPRSHVLAMQPASYTWDELRARHDTPAGLTSWLAETVELESGKERLEEGDAVRMQLKDGGRLTGHVLARTRIELLLSWEEQNGVLGLKGYDKPSEGTFVALDFNAWPLPAGVDPTELKGSLQGALERLASSLS